MVEYKVVFVDAAENVRVENITAANKQNAIDKIRDIDGVADIISITKPHVW